jgi:hypothetical protein
MEVNAVLRMGDSRVVSAADDAMVRVWDWRAATHAALTGHEVGVGIQDLYPCRTGHELLSRPGLEG